MSVNKYELELRAICPVHENLIDVYELTITTSDLIEVEKIIEFVSKYKTQQIFQEKLTSEIAVGLGAHVKTVGIHAGVKVTCEAP